MKRFMILITVIAAAYLSVPRAGAQGDSDLVWIHSLDIWTELESLYLSPDGRHVLASGSGSIHYIDVETGETVDSIMHQGNIGGFSPDKRYFYTYTKWSGGTVVKKMDAITHEIVKSSGMIAPYMITGLDVLNDGRVIISIAQGNNLYYILDGNDLTVLDSMPIQPPYNYGASNICVYTEGNIAAFLQKGVDNSDPFNTKYYSDISLFNIKEKKYIKSLPKSLIPNIYGWKFFPNGNRIAINNSNKVKIIDISTLSILDSFNVATNDIIFSKDGKAIFLPTKINGIKTINTNNLQEICTSTLYNGYIAVYLTLTADERYIIAADINNAALMKIKNCYKTTGIVDKKNEIISMIYPNPGTDSFIIHNNQITDKTYPAEVTNSTGVFIIKKPISFINGTGTFSAGGLSQGIYFIRLLTPKKVYTYKFEVGR